MNWEGAGHKMKGGEREGIPIAARLGGKERKMLLSSYCYKKEENASPNVSIGKDLNIGRKN